MNVWLFIYRLALAIFVAMLVVAAVSLFLPKIRQNQERHRRVLALEEERRAKEDQVKQLELQQDRFLSDPAAVERVAREELGKARSGETIYRFTDRKTNAYRLRP